MSENVDFEAMLQRVLAVYRSFDKRLTEDQVAAIRQTLRMVPSMATAPAQFLEVAKSVAKRLERLSLKDKK